MTIEDNYNMLEIQERTSLLIPRIEFLLKCLKLRSLYKSEAEEINAILADIKAIYDLAHL